MNDIDHRSSMFIKMIMKRTKSHLKTLYSWNLAYEKNEYSKRLETAENSFRLIMKHVLLSERCSWRGGEKVSTLQLDPVTPD